ncbi:MAG: biotin/lipoyl-binding protein, partial [Clostridia bacterium]|nr:biotin/lipoyl-binding protein [Clostridia bacterium]
MANPILMPKAGITVESCILTEWNVKVGDAVKVGDVLATYETDKSSFELTSEFDGEVLALFCEAGDEVPVLTNIAVVGAKGEDVSAFAPGGAPAAAPAVAEVKTESAPAAAPAVAEVKTESAPAVAPSAPSAPLNPNVKPVTMPKAGITVESCILTEWKVKVGD